MMTSLICRDCKYLIGMRHQPENGDRWKCDYTNNTELKSVDLVTGLQEKIFKHSIYELRENFADLCGLEGRWFEEYISPKRETYTANELEASTIGGVQATEIVFDDAALAGVRKAAELKLLNIKRKKLGLDLLLELPE